MIGQSEWSCSSTVVIQCMFCREVMLGCYVVAVLLLSVTVLRSNVCKKVKSAHELSSPSDHSLFSSFCSVKRLGVFLLPPG